MSTAVANAQSISTRQSSQAGTSITGRFLALALVLCVFEGAFRKWVIPDATPAEHAAPYFSKDVALALAVIASVGRRGRSAVLGPLRDVLLAATFFVGCGTLIAVEGFAPVGAIVSFRHLVLLPWVAFVVGPALRRGDLPLLCYTAGACAAVNAVLGGLQFFLPPGDILNRQVTSQLQAVASVGRIRASGTFAFISGMGNLGVLACWAGAVMVCRQPLSWLGYAIVVAGLACAFEAMSRAGAMYGTAVIVLTVTFYYKRQWGVVVAALLLLTSFLLLRGTDSVENAGGPGIGRAIFTRHMKADTIEDRVSWILGSVPAAALDVPLGTGLGRGQTGQKMANDRFYAFIYEIELARIVFEIGVLGLAAALLTRIAVPLILWQAWGRAGPRRRLQWEAAWYPTLAVFPLLIMMYNCFDHVMATFALIITAVGIAAVSAPLEDH